MISRIAKTSKGAIERPLGFAPVFAALGPVYPMPNAVNRFTYSRREVLFAT
jgi:hypothetical protein